MTPNEEGTLLRELADELRERIDWSRDVKAADLVRRAEEAAQPQDERGQGLSAYDAGLLNDYGGGNVEWWQDYIRAELGRAHEFYQSQIAASAAQPVALSTLTKTEVCRNCHGAGHWIGDGGYSDDQCDACDGKGKIRIAASAPALQAGQGEPGRNDAQPV